MTLPPYIPPPPPSPSPEPKTNEASVRAPNGFPLARPFVGRRDQLDQLKAQLRQGTTTGVTALKGMGGIGKTALAAQAVLELADEPDTFPGHALWIACENLRGAEGLDELWRRVASALDVSLANVPNPAGTLNAALQSRPRTLVALDNIEAEHRERVDGREVILPPLDVRAALNALAVPDQTVLLLTARQALAPERVTPMRVDQLEPSDAIDLFIARLAQASEGARPTAEDRALIPSLTHNLGELPLAIELTAAYAGQDISLPTIAKELERDGVNAAALQSDPEHAITSRFERSKETLTEPQRLLFAGLSLCAGPSFPRAAAVALAAAINHPGTEEITLGPEAELDVSALVRFALAESLSRERLRLHPLLRDYAGKRLRALPAETQHMLGEWLAIYWLAYAQAHPGYEGMDALEAEAENLVGAVEWARDNGKHQLVLAFTYALYRAWDTRGRRRDQRKMYTAALSAATARNDQSEQRWAIHELAVLDAQTGNIAVARAGYLRALRLAEELGDKAAIQSETHDLAVLDAQTGNIAVARAGYERALALAEELGDKAAIQTETHGLAVLDAQTGNIQAARAGYERALALAEELGDKRAISLETRQLAVLDRRTGNIDAARAGSERALALAEELGDKRAIQVAIHDLAVLEQDPMKARAGFERALALAEELGDKRAIRDETHELAALDAQTGNVQAARAGFERALALAEELGDKSGIQAEMHAQAVLAINSGDVRAARVGFERSLELGQELGDSSAIASDLQSLGYVLCVSGEPQHGREMLAEAIRMYTDLGDVFELGTCYEYWARLDEGEDNTSGAIQRYRQALALYEQVQAADRIAEVREALRRLGAE